MPTVSGKDKFFAELETLIAKARELQSHGFDEQEPEEATKQSLIEPLLHALGFSPKTNYTREFKILGDSVDYLLKFSHPLMFVEAKSLLDCWGKNLFDKHREQVHRYIQNYRLSPEITAMEQPVKWILLTNFAQLHFIRVNEVTPSFSFKLDDLWKRREELWELLALENLEANRIDEIYDQHKRAGLDQMFLADLKRWRLLIANGFALRNQKRSLDEITLASQQLLDRFIFCLMLETQRLVEFNKLARTYSNYEVLFARADKTFGEILRESLFVEIKKDFNTELFEQPLLCDQMEIDTNMDFYATWWEDASREGSDIMSLYVGCQGGSSLGLRASGDLINTSLRVNAENFDYEGAYGDETKTNIDNALMKLMAADLRNLEVGKTNKNQ